MQVLSDLLLERGVQVCAIVDDGAEALGILIAEQPDLLVVEDPMSSLTSVDLCTEAAMFAPATRIMVLVESPLRVGRLLDAGAQAVVTRRGVREEFTGSLDAVLTSVR